MITALIHLASKLKVSERGTAIVTVIGALVATTAFGITVTAGAVIFAKDSNRDRSVKRSFSASEAGVQEARYRMNMLQPTESSPCVTTGAGGTYSLAPAPAPGEWCPAESIDIGNGITVSYQVGPYSINNGVVTRNIVSTATVNGVSRRIEATASANTGAPLFDSFAISSEEELSLKGGSKVTSGDVRGNRDIVLTGNSSICPGGATPGPAYEVVIGPEANVCGPTTPASTAFALNPVDQGDAPTNNDNDRITTGQDPSSGINWDPGERELRLSGSDTLNLSGHTYSFCRLQISGGNAILSIDAGATVRIFFDSTANCKYSDGFEQLTVTGQGWINNTSGVASNLQIYFVGGTPEEFNKAKICGGGGATSMAVYGPYTEFKLCGNGSALNGAFYVGKMELDGGALLSYDESVESIVQGTIGVFRNQKFVECSSVNPGGDPDSGC